MEVQETIINKVAQSGLVSFDLNPVGERIIYDIKDNLFHGLILREKDFREFVKTHNWEIYREKHVGIMCSADAIVPTWAYMLLATKLAPFASNIVFGDLQMLEAVIFERAVNAFNLEKYHDQRIVVKGCGEVYIPVSAFVTLTARLEKIAKSIMYGEPCSTVPIYKRKD